MVSVAMDSGWGEDGSETIQELESREAEGCTAGGIRLKEQVENLVGTAADEMETIEREGRPGKTNASRRCPRMRRSSPSRSVASIRTLASRLNPPPWENAVNCTRLPRRTARV